MTRRCIAVVFELFPRRVRGVGFGVSFNCALGVFGGVAPLISEALWKRVEGGDGGWAAPTVGAAWPIVACLVSGVGLWHVRRREIEP